MYHDKQVALIDAINIILISFFCQTKYQMKMMNCLSCIKWYFHIYHVCICDTRLSILSTNASLLDIFMDINWYFHDVKYVFSIPCFWHRWYQNISTFYWMLDVCRGDLWTLINIYFLHHCQHNKSYFKDISICINVIYRGIYCAVHKCNNMKFARIMEDDGLWPLQLHPQLFLSQQVAYGGHYRVQQRFYHCGTVMSAKQLLSFGDKTLGVREGGHATL